MHTWHFGKGKGWYEGQMTKWGWAEFWNELTGTEIAAVYIPIYNFIIIVNAGSGEILGISLTL